MFLRKPGSRVAQAERAAGNGSCSQVLRGDNVHPCCSVFVAQVVPEMFPKNLGSVLEAERLGLLPDL